MRLFFWASRSFAITVGLANIHNVTLKNVYLELMFMFMLMSIKINIFVTCHFIAKKSQT